MQTPLSPPLDSLNTLTMSTEVGKLPVVESKDEVSVKDGKLFPTETFWANHQTWLKEAGYLLRPRYQPDWVASWIKDPSKFWVACEDSLTPLVC